MFITTITTLMVVAFVSIYAKIPDAILDRMNDQVDPCVDFYEYACGGWLRDHQLKPFESHVVSYEIEISKTIQDTIIKIIRESYPRLREYWDSCINFDQISDLGNKPLQEDLRRIVEAKEKNDILKVAGTFFRSGTNTFIQFTIGPDANDATTNTLNIKPADLLVFHLAVNVLQRGTISKSVVITINVRVNGTNKEWSSLKSKNTWQVVQYLHE